MYSFFFGDSFCELKPFPSFFVWGKFFAERVNCRAAFANKGDKNATAFHNSAGAGSPLAVTLKNAEVPPQIFMAGIRSIVNFAGRRQAHEFEMFKFTIAIMLTELAAGEIVTKDFFEFHDALPLCF